MPVYIVTVERYDEDGFPAILAELSDRASDDTVLLGAVDEIAGDVADALRVFADKIDGGDTYGQTTGGDTPPEPLAYMATV